MADVRLETLLRLRHNRFYESKLDIFCDLIRFRYGYPGFAPKSRVFPWSDIHTLSDTHIILSKILRVKFHSIKLKFHSSLNKLTMLIRVKSTRKVRVKMFTQCFESTFHSVLRAEKHSMSYFTRVKNHSNSLSELLLVRSAEIQLIRVKIKVTSRKELICHRNGKSVTH